MGGVSGRSRPPHDGGGCSALRQRLIVPHGPRAPVRSGRFDSKAQKRRQRLRFRPDSDSRWNNAGKVAFQPVDKNELFL